MNLNQDVIGNAAVKEMKNSIRFLRIFMNTICLIIVVRQIIIIIYDLSYSYEVIDLKDYLITVTVLIYLTEILLVLMMSQLIQETSKT